ncbi:MAG: UDP-4-amino-4,6-dideoxy-N-acetyl-beta-L-altrosamine transaminase [Parcubacteria group bacterium]|nr:UDP-4-amino-4,6-dideoxy-N-acetyl-beta-L-altrosamine transaminase [Parcubacteria group bacterium]|tara:strand:+ start:413 stop:1594 length:1182 start_codon:yes stop_codon:yes gene_type:complete
MSFAKSDVFIPFSPPCMGNEEEEEVLDSLRSGWITTGPKVKEFEKRVAEYVNAKHAVAMFSCTDAMLLALMVLGIQKGDEIITTPFTFASTGHVICHHGAKPVFVDVDPETFNIDPRKIEEAITPKTRGIIPVHYAGHSCDMDPILDIVQKHKLFVMEDAAHAIGTEYNGRKIGNFGDITCFSFYATKNLATAEGGMAVTNNEEWAKRMRILTMYGISDAREIWQNRYTQAGPIHHDIVELGYKCNMTDLCAGIGIQQLAKLDVFNEMRGGFAKTYDDAFKGHHGFKIPVIKDYTKTTRHLYPLLLNLEYFDIDRDLFINELKENNIGTSVLFKPLHFHSYYANKFSFKIGDFPVAERVFDQIICLPISPKLAKGEIEKVIETLLFVANSFKR